MDELPPNARAFLDVARVADDPSPDQRARSDEALRAALARQGIRDLPQLAAAAGTGTGAARTGLGPRAALVAKLGVGAVAVVAASYLGVRTLVPESRDAPRVQPAAATTSAPEVPAPMAPPPPQAELVRESARPAPASPARRPESQRAARAVNDSLAAALRTVAAVDALVRENRFGDALRMLEQTEGEAAAVLQEERTALRILARCGIEPSARVLRERDHFLRASPRSVLAERVRSACTKPVRETP